MLHFISSSAQSFQEYIVGLELSFLVLFISFRFLFVVFGCCGKDERGKRPMMTKIATDKSDVTILTSDNPKDEDPCMYFLHGL